MSKEAFIELKQLYMLSLGVINLIILCNKLHYGGFYFKRFAYHFNFEKHKKI